MNYILVGMPGAGKSTIGPALAARIGSEFIDTDTIIKEKTGSELKQLVSSLGYEAFLNIQEEAILSLKPVDMVIATGGSAVCSDDAMKHLKKDGTVIFLELDFDEVEKRLAPGRKLARSSDKSLFELYSERLPLYKKYADMTVDCSDRSVESIVDEILK